MDSVQPQMKDATVLNRLTKCLLGYDEDPVQSFIQILKESKLHRPPTGKLFIVTGETAGVHEAILKRAITTGSKVEVTDDPRDCDAVVVFCPIVSQIRLDVDPWMKLIPDLAQGKPVVLVLMHPTTDTDYDVGEPQWSKTPRVRSEVHILYDETTGELLEGPRNDQAIGQLQGIFDRLGVPIIPCSIS